MVRTRPARAAASRRCGRWLASLWALAAFATPTVADRLQVLPPFVANEGSQPAIVAFTARSRLGTTFVTRDAALVHVLAPRSRASATGWSVVERFVGGTTRNVGGEDETTARFAAPDRDGAMHDLHAFAKVSVQRLYPGIDLSLAHREGGIERIYRIAPGADPARVRIALDGASGTHIDSEGRLLVDTPEGVLALSAPVAWQESVAGRVAVPVRYRISGRTHGFKVGKYDQGKPLYIDPILATTYVGGSGDDSAQRIAIHPFNGDVYATGGTTSPDFPGIAGGAVAISTGLVYVARFDRSLQSLRQATLLPAREPTSRLAIHPGSGDIYVIGTSPSFPLQPGSCPAIGVFVVRLAADLRTVRNSACIQYSGEYVNLGGIGVGLNGDVYASAAGIVNVGGDTTGNGFSIVFPLIARYGADLTFKGSIATGGGPIAVSPATGDLYVLDDPNYLEPSLRRLSAALAPAASIVVGRSHAALGVHPTNGDVYAVGYGYDSPTSFPRAAVTRFDAGLSAVRQSILFGGSGGEGAATVAFDPSTGDVFVAGYTSSVDVPNTSGSAQPAYGGGLGDGLVARLPASLSIVLRATYFGGSGFEQITGLAVDAGSGELLVSGHTTSPDLPARAGFAQPSLRGPTDGFIARIGKSLTGAGALIAIGGSGQRAKAGYPYASPLSVRLLDVDNVPVPGASVTFALPESGPRATFAGGATIATVVTGADGVAGSPQLTASLEPGAFVATATAGALSANFYLDVDPTSAVVVPANHPLAILLCVAGVALLAALRLRATAQADANGAKPGGEKRVAGRDARR